MAENDFEDASNNSLPIDERGRFPNFQEFLQHTLSCVNPECVLPHCVNMKLALKHSQGCKKETCLVCQQMKSLASKHSESCMDVYCCLPFCMEEKLRSFVHSQCGQIGDCLEAAPQAPRTAAVGLDTKSIGNRRGLSTSPERKEAATPHNTERCSSPNPGSSKAEGSTPNQIMTSTLEFPSSSLYRTNSFPSVNLKRINRSASLNMPSTFAKSARLNSEHRRCESLVNENVGTDNSQSKPMPASRENPSRPRAQTMPNPLLAVEGGMLKHTATKTQSLEELSTSSNLQSGHALDYGASQRSDTRVQKTSDLLNVACLSSGRKASHITRSEEDISSVTTSVIEDSRTMLKGRLIHTIYNLLHLIMQKMERKEEIIICINSLRNALHQITTLLHDRGSTN